MYRLYGLSVPLLSGLPIYLETLEKDKQRTNVVLHDERLDFFSLITVYAEGIIFEKALLFLTEQIIFGLHCRNIIILSKEYLDKIYRKN